MLKCAFALGLALIGSETTLRPINDAYRIEVDQCREGPCLRVYSSTTHPRNYILGPEYEQANSVGEVLQICENEALGQTVYEY